jgi:hypothetical protein
VTNNNSGNELLKISDISRQLVDNMSDIVWVVNPSTRFFARFNSSVKGFLFRSCSGSLEISFKAKGS